MENHSLEEVVAHWHSHRQCRGETKRRQGKDCRDGRMGGCVVRHVSAGEASAMSVICHTNNSWASGLYTTSPPLVPIAFATTSVITIFPANPNPLDLVQLSKSYNSYHVPSSWPFAHSTFKHSTQRIRSVPWNVFQCRMRVRMGAGVFHLKLRPPPSCKKPPTVISRAHSSNSWDTVQQSKYIEAWMILIYEYFRAKGLETGQFRNCLVNELPSFSGVGLSCCFPNQSMCRGEAMRNGGEGVDWELTSPSGAVERSTRHKPGHMSQFPRVVLCR